MRADVNVSVRKVGSDELNTRCEIKNVNSVRFIMQAIEAESQRQVEVWENGGEVVQETRLFDPANSETRTMRSKEFAHDYRYFPDPDLLPLNLTQAYVDAIAATLPELPDEKKERYMSEFGLSAYDAGVLVVERETGAYYETVVGQGDNKNRDAKLAANWVITNLFGALNAKSLSIEESPVSADQLGQLLDLMADDTINGRIAKDVFEDMVETSKNPADIVEDKGLKQVTDTGAIEAAIDDVIANNPGQVAEFKGGNEKIAGWFVGQVMKATQGKANPGMVNKLLKDKLSS